MHVPLSHSPCPLHTVLPVVAVGSHSQQPSPAHPVSQEHMTVPLNFIHCPLSLHEYVLSHAIESGATVATEAADSLKRARALIEVEGAENQLLEIRNGIVKFGFVEAGTTC
eukprot:gb/GECG01008014.1/.p1 GENE.gb/GECG01008014.1/~~gb/GECG01008014.1/.p1  ORF type:complete len:111 (+),score=7.91 gb/GECG01008014.1/:1-333(+)